MLNQNNKKTFSYISLFLFVIFVSTSTGEESEMPKFAKWYKNKRAAVSLRFDDSHDSHVKVAIPLLKKYGFKATFMVNPGRSEYKRYKDFWEKEVPQMGHRLGNHTLNHKGARTIEQAEIEIGEVSKLIWRLYPKESKLTVFASGGGGKKWGGEYWKNASQEYKDIVHKYSLIDLYDGKHASKRGDAETLADDLCENVKNTINEMKYQPFHFHNIGKLIWKDKARILLSWTSLTLPENEFEKFLRCLSEEKDQVWIAPVIDILKYQKEYKSANLQIIQTEANKINLKLNITTDPDLYDHKLTLIVPPFNGKKPLRLVQGNLVHNQLMLSDNESLFDVEPVNSKIEIVY